MNELKLKAKRKNTDDWLLFGITELFHGENGYFQVCVEDVGLFAIDPATIRLSDNPCKRMLAEIRQSLKGLILVQGKGLPLGYPCDWVDAILDEKEAKL